MPADPPDPVTRRRRRPRMRADDVRAAVLTSAQELIYDLGIAVTLDDLGMEDVIRHAGVPRSSVYRIWPYKGDFVDDLLTHLAGPQWLGQNRFNEESVAVAVAVIQEAGDRLADPAERMPVVREAVRRGVEYNVAALVKSPEWRMFMTLKATLRSVRDEDTRQRLAVELLRSETEFLTTMAAFYQMFGQVTGLRLRNPAIGWEYLAVLGASAAEGLVLRRDVVDLAGPAAVAGQPGAHQLAQIVRGTAPGPWPQDPPQQWIATALVYQAMIETIAEPDPDVVPPVLPVVPSQ